MHLLTVALRIRVLCILLTTLVYDLPLEEQSHVRYTTLRVNSLPSCNPPKSPLHLYNPFSILTTNEPSQCDLSIPISSFVSSLKPLFSEEWLNMSTRGTSLIRPPPYWRSSSTSTRHYTKRPLDCLFCRILPFTRPMLFGKECSVVSCHTAGYSGNISL